MGIAVSKNNKKNRAELEAELKILKSVRRSEAYVVLGQSAIKYGGFVWMSYFAYLSLVALAGQTTFTSIVVDVLGGVKTSTSLGWFVGIAGAVYGFIQRSLRKDVVERLSGRIKQLEQEIDPRRSSSRLTVRGDTRPEDIL
jgi:hypothetical protein